MAPVPLLSPVLLALALTTVAGLATVVGGLLVLGRRTPGPRTLAFGLAFAAGAMVFISLVEILPSAAEHFTDSALGGGDLRWGTVWATAAFLLGMLLFLALDRPTGGLTRGPTSDEASLRRVGVLTAIAITAHNFPEGMATFFTTLEGPELGVPMAAAIAIHNIPEGIAVALPVLAASGSRRIAVLVALGSGLAEPVGALLGYAVLAPFLSPAVFGAVFGGIAGAMVFLALMELLPVAYRHSEGREAGAGLITGMAVLAASLVLLQW